MAGRPGCATPGNRMSHSRLATSRTYGEPQQFAIFIQHTTWGGGLIKGDHMKKMKALLERFSSKVARSVHITVLEKGRLVLARELPGLGQYFITNGQIYEPAGGDFFNSWCDGNIIIRDWDFIFLLTAEGEIVEAVISTQKPNLGFIKDALNYFDPEKEVSLWEERHWACSFPFDHERYED